ncbi:cupin domain-containing protein [Methylobacterium sp. WL116]|uniref:cupin domain-containing protein n=2 Tax=unclassified Methylobacterium TaxID=2615210 RepID=UPI0011C8DBA4|nr:cupin domain-containing protein [Methylobacterium sp. WL116]TXM94608.1 cupin domain-containing protein [Methylobacterium sp. WL116]
MILLSWLSKGFLAMVDGTRRAILGGITLAAGALSVRTSSAAEADGHAAGYDVAPASKFASTIPRKVGDAVSFTTSLDKGLLKATSGGWARDVTARILPIATDIAGAHLYLNAGGVREMHWHTSDEWAYILAGRCQVTVVDPSGEMEVANYGPGDLWYFPKGHSHAIQTLGAEPCHAILAFNDGLYGEHGTFGLSDWASRLDPAMMAQVFGMPEDSIAGIPSGEVYIRQGALMPLDGPQSRATKVLSRSRTHRYPMLAAGPQTSSDGGSLAIASAEEYPMSAGMTGMLLRLQPGALHEPHWHPNANEWHYVSRGRTRVTLFAPDKRLSVAELSAGDCAYLPRGCGHTVQNIGKEECEVVGVLDSGSYQETSLSDWVQRVPAHLLANNLGLPDEAFAKLPRKKSVIIAAA